MFMSLSVFVFRDLVEVTGCHCAMGGAPSKVLPGLLSGGWEVLEDNKVSV